MGGPDAEALTHSLSLLYSRGFLGRGHMSESMKLYGAMSYSSILSIINEELALKLKMYSQESGTTDLNSVTCVTDDITSAIIREPLCNYMDPHSIYYSVSEYRKTFTFLTN